MILLGSPAGRLALVPDALGLSCRCEAVELKESSFSTCQKLIQGGFEATYLVFSNCVSSAAMDVV